MDLLHRGDISFINQNYESAIAYYDRAMDHFEHLSLVSKFRLTSHRLGALLQLILYPKILGAYTDDYEKELTPSDSSRLKKALEDADTFWKEFQNKESATTLLSDATSLLAEFPSEVMDGEVEMFHTRMAQGYYILKKIRESLNEWTLAMNSSSSYDKIQSYRPWIDRCNSQVVNNPSISNSSNPPKNRATSSLVLGSPTPPKYQYYQTDSILTIAMAIYLMDRYI